MEERVIKKQKLDSEFLKPRQRKNLRTVKAKVENIKESNLLAQQKESERLASVINRQLLSELPGPSVAPSSVSSTDIDTADDEKLSNGNVECFGLHTNDRLNVCDEVGRVLVNVGHSPEEPDVFLAPQLSLAAKAHQIGGIRFMYDNIVENLGNFSTSGGLGCVLAHSMGLGKTFQICAFSDVFLRHTKAKTILILTPLSTLQNWANEFDRWLPSAELNSEKGVLTRSFNVHILNEKTNELNSRSMVISNWTRDGGVLIMGYDLFRNLYTERKKTNIRHAGVKTLADEIAIKTQTLTDIYRALINPGSDLIVLDEGHRLKNDQTSTSQVLNEVLTRRRIVLTGYPLQNNLLEYWVMIDFVRPNFLGTKTDFGNDFQRPIENGQCVDSRPSDVKLMKERVHQLRNLLHGFVQRRSDEIQKNFLPPKNEQVLLLRMSPLQRQLYKQQLSELTLDKINPNPLEAFAAGTRIWNHPDVLHGLVSGSTEVAEKPEDEIAPLIAVSVTEQVGPSGNPSFVLKTSRFQGTTPKVKILSKTIQDLFQGYIPGDYEIAAKTAVFFSILDATVMVGDRLLVFSQSLHTLNLLEKFLGKRKIPNREEVWIKDQSYVRLDGSTTGMERERLVNEFNSSPDIFLFLISTRAGATGINLTGANRVVIFDVSWNPCDDAQAVCRIYRFGQEKQCFVYRLVIDHSLEKNIFTRQIGKRVIADRVVDELNRGSFLTTKEATNLLYQEEDPPERDPMLIGTNFQTTDSVLNEVVIRCSNWLTKTPFELSSLLVEEQDTSKLNKDEKKCAQANVVNPKTGPLVSPNKTSIFKSKTKPRKSSQTTRERLLAAMSKMSRR